MKRLLLAAALALGIAAPACAGTPQHLVDSSTLALEDMIGSSAGGQIQYMLRHAKAVVICPNIFRAGFIFGGEGGVCVLSARTADGSWSYPAFYSLGSGSFGLQIGVQSAEVMMMVMTKGGLDALLNSQFKIGADAGLSIATLGGGVNGSMSTALNADIVSFSDSEGLYGGVSLSGAVFSDDTDLEQRYYGQAPGARAIVLYGQGSNPGANPLRTLLQRYGVPGGVNATPQ
ncbi:lipid-binding SYLF domain-containing protein [Acidocella aromatica]|uniref:Lipid-binding SYLF domain-containing protein n=1 Tax=Acidocella aromatica TaxID=1303579 RepID=A0A840VP81_9PROT|nr:lipid-binding SYLF domain-containing protein [Acidocella aromatica]MBB5373949.1 lipid-binding SYLF domain-containing protein [Acidocella aromatica]